MHAGSMTQAAFILILGTFAPVLCLSIDSTSAAHPHSVPHEHHPAKLKLLEVSTAAGVCVDAASAAIAHEPGVRLLGEVALWRYPPDAGEPHALVVQPLPILPDTARALFQVYRL